MKMIEGFPAYQVDEDGGVYSVRSGKFLKPSVLKHGGYLVVMLGRKRMRYVHKLVAEAFLGPCPIGEPVRHLDGNSANPSLSNLAYGTQSQNEADKVGHKRDNGCQRNGQAKLTDQQALAIRDSKNTGRSLARRFGVSEATISRVKNRTHWKRLPKACGGVL